MRLVLALLVAGLLAASAAAAQAQLGVDTELTPEAKPAGSPGPASQWTVLGGAEYRGEGELVKFSETPATVDFFTTSFSPNYVGDAAVDDPGNPEGFFGGAECIEEVDPTDEALASCTRRPAIYRYYLDAAGDPQIDKVPTEELLENPDEQGFVGAIAWLDRDTALAVGGTLEYPRREPGAVRADEVRPGESYDEAYARKDAEQGAGMARAWLYDDDDGDGADEAEDADGIWQWRELADDEVPEPMRGLTALDCATTTTRDSYYHTSPVRGQTCVAGGMQQLWWWRPGESAAQDGFDPDPVTGGVGGELPDFHYRVRQVRVNQMDGGGPSWPHIVAVTSGCCSDPHIRAELGSNAAEGLSGARVLIYGANPPTWRSESFSPLAAEDASAADAPLPDSYYGVVSRGSALSAIVSPGGNARSEDSGSRIVTRVAGSTVSDDAATQDLDALRLHATDGDFATTDTPQKDLDGKFSDGLTRGGSLLDWAVGSAKEGSREGMAPGVAYTTNSSILPLPSPFTCQLGVAADESIASREPPSGCDFKPDRLTGYGLNSERLVVFPTYALNAISFVPGMEASLAWAAGDRGALARLGGEGRLGGEAEPEAPPLRPGRAAPTTDTGHFDPFRPTTAQPGVVPALAAQPFETLPSATMVPYGSADATRPTGANEQITSLAMSRDGSEGWAVGSGGAGAFGNTFTLQHFDGERWVRCDPEGLEGAFEPDAACRSLAPLRSEGLTLAQVARIPLERDDDPTNDDEFEVIAIGTPTPGNGGVFRYTAAGGWRVDPGARNVTTVPSQAVDAQVAFRTPDDGWIATAASSTSSGRLYRYIGGAWPEGRWVNCGGGNPACGANVSLLGGRRTVGDLHVEVAGETVFVAGTHIVGQNSTGVPYAFVLSLDVSATHPTWRAEYDPGTEPNQQTADAQGEVTSFSVVPLDEGVAGWLGGRFGRPGGLIGSDSDDLTRSALGPDHVLMRRDPSAGTWSFRDSDDAVKQFLSFDDAGSTPPELVSFRGADRSERSFILPGEHANEVSFPPLEYAASTDRWQVMRAPFVSSTNISNANERATQGVILAAAPDNQGGLWVVARMAFGNSSISRSASFFYRYSDQRRQEVFEDTSSPIDIPISDLDGTSDGTVWVSTESDLLYRYDRIAGWETIRIPDWDRGRVVTRSSKTLAVAVNESGIGIAVGEDGRIANLTPTDVRLDPASANRCTDGPSPCGTPRDLAAAEVGPDGSAMAGGKNATLTWRPAGGEFRAIDAPRISRSAEITDIAMPLPDRAWVTTRQGWLNGSNSEIWAGTATQAGGRWRWRWEREATSEAARDVSGRISSLEAIELDGSGRGLAVGFRGAILERSSDGSWTRIQTGYLDNFFSVELPPDGYGNGDGVLIGGGLGMILTRTAGEFHLARQGDAFAPLTAAPILVQAARIEGLSLAGGRSVGEVEAWAASQVLPGSSDPSGRLAAARDPAPFALLRYTSGDDPLLAPETRAAPLADTPEPSPGQLSLAALGRSECQFGNCPPFQGTNLFNEVLTRRIQDELDERSGATSGIVGAVFTGDLNSSPGRDEERSMPIPGLAATPHYPTDTNISGQQWRDFVAKPILNSEVPIFGATGAMDLSRARICQHAGVCVDPQDYSPAGTATQWQETFADMPAPWGTAEPYSANGHDYRPVESSLPKVDVAAATGEQRANSHYALDVVRESDEEPIARLVFADTSNARSLAASDANQNPLEPQEVWLEEVLCQEGSAADTAALDCTRPEGLPAVVTTTTPTYSYGPGGVDGTQAEAASFESLLLRHEVTALVTGHLGWNGLYYTCAPGLHTPAPGGEHPAGPPRSAAECAAGAPSQTDALDPPDPQALAAGTGAAGLLPTVVAASAGGRFGPQGNEEGSAADGFWHGYSVVRIPADGDPSKVIVEQRPILDWIGITARDHVIGPRQRMTLDGFGREPLGTDTSVRMLEIDSHAITHRYDLLLADPEEPWMPCLETDSACTTLHANLEQRSQALEANETSGEQNLCAPYLCLPKRIGTVDETTGQVRSGDGRYPETFALAMLSVGQKAATWPLVFERSPSFVTRSALRAPGAPQLNNVPTPGTPGQQPPPEVPQIPKIEVPAIPPPPAIPSLSATAPPELTPPTPPAPPPPSQQPAPLDLSVAPPGVSISTPTALIQPPTPPVNPAPPGGARKEARQRQAAAQKGGADSEDASQGSETQESGGDLAIGRDQPMRRLEILPARQRASAWSNGALYGGGITLTALVLALGYTTLRPTPRRSAPPMPAPGWASYRRRR
jgi:hypothetical protein